MSALSVWFLLVFVPGLALPVFVLGVVSLVALLLVPPALACEDDLPENIGKKTLKWGLVGLISCSLIGAGIPDKNEIAAIVLIPYVSNNPELQKLPESLAKRLNDLLKSYEPTIEDVKNVTKE